ncbi:MAG: biotin/lipoyl-binding protein [Lachnospiraceae bacterium]
MNKTAKRFLCIILVIAVACAAAWGGMILIRNAQKKPVNVYPVSSFSEMSDYTSSSQTYGTVTMDHMQKITLTETQTVKKIHVKEGQSVKKGDKLLSYDTTLTDIDLEKARIELNKLKLQKTTAENDLAKYRKMKPHSSVLITPSSDITYTPQETPMLLAGSGTQDDPFYYLWSEDNTLDSEMLNRIFSDKKENRNENQNENRNETGTSAADVQTDSSQQENESTPDTDAAPADPSQETEATSVKAPSGTSSREEAWAVLIVRENNALNGQITDSWGIHLDQSSGNLQIQFFQPELPEEIQQYDAIPEPYYQESGSDYTASELAAMKAEKEQEIKDLEVSIKIAELDLKQKEKENTDGTVLSTIDGTVKVLRNPDKAFKNNEPVIEISAGGGYYISGALSELELGTVQVGQTVQISSWTTGTYCEGEIVEISDYPTTSAYSYSSNGNTNVSYYPFRVFVDESANLVENDAVDITYQTRMPAEGTSFFYLENSFIRTDNGKNWVYVRGEDGLLEQRTVQTGKDLYGAYTEIRSGLTPEDYIAFPYGKDAADGAQTNEATPDELYEY